MSSYLVSQFFVHQYLVLFDSDLIYISGLAARCWIFSLSCHHHDGPEGFEVELL